MCNRRSKKPGNQPRPNGGILGLWRYVGGRVCPGRWLLAAEIVLIASVSVALDSYSDTGQEETAPGALAPEDALIVVSPEGFWFEFPEAEEKVPEAAEEEKARKEAEARARHEAEEKVPEAAEEEKARKEAEARARREAEEKARKEAEARARREAEEKARKMAEEEKAQKEAEATAQREAEEEARKEAEEKAGKQAGLTQTFSGIEMVWIPAGTFEMGSKLSAGDVEMVFGGDAGHFQDEHPRHSVRLTKGFWMSKYEVTNGQFEQFANATGYKTEAEREGSGRVWNGTDWEDRGGASWRHPGWDIDPNQSVALVSWNDARAYIDWLNSRGDGLFRLPTEAQWEYACRAGGIGLFCYGDEVSKLGEYARYRANALALGEAYPALVGTKKPNAWGLYDMHGNVSEWCQDWYDEGYYAYAPAANPQGPENGTYRSLRGGSWYSFPQFFRSASRTRGIPSYRYFVLGFRICRDE